MAKQGWISQLPLNYFQSAPQVWRAPGRRFDLGWIVVLKYALEKPPMCKNFVTRLSGLLASGLLLFYSSGAEDPHRNYPESATVSSFGIVATSQTLASQAGAAILERGGNAVDAAIGANAALGVIEPMMNGVGGDLFAIVYEAKTGKVVGINSSGWAPKGTSIEFLRAHGVTGKIPEQSVYAVTVPGTVAGWAALQQKFGKLSLADDSVARHFYGQARLSSS